MISFEQRCDVTGFLLYSQIYNFYDFLENLKRLCVALISTLILRWPLIAYLPEKNQKRNYKFHSPQYYIAHNTRVTMHIYGGRSEYRNLREIMNHLSELLL